jgi:hypothetical protein
MIGAVYPIRPPPGRAAERAVNKDCGHCRHAGEPGHQSVVAIHDIDLSTGRFGGDRTQLAVKSILFEVDLPPVVAV